jgi:hypothetical protein
MALLKTKASGESMPGGYHFMIEAANKRHLLPYFVVSFLLSERGISINFPYISLAWCSATLSPQREHCPHLLSRDAKSAYAIGIAAIRFADLEMLPVAVSFAFHKQTAITFYLFSSPVSD